MGSLDNNGWNRQVSISAMTGKSQKLELQNNLGVVAVQSCVAEGTKKTIK